MLPLSHRKTGLYVLMHDLYKFETIAKAFERLNYKKWLVKSKRFDDTSNDLDKYLKQSLRLLFGVWPP